MIPSKTALAFAGIVVALAAGSSAQAASFDCAAAKTVREHAVCSSPKLSALDDRLGALYRQRSALLSAPGLGMLKQSQRSWLRYVDTICPAYDRSFGNTTGPEFCFEREYDDRLKQLAQVGQMVGPFRFNRVDRFSANAAEADDQFGASPHFYTGHVAYPQIDAPRTAAELAWNRKNVKTEPVANCDGVGDDDTDYDLGHAHRNFISVQWSDYSYCHGAAHGMGGSFVDNEILTPSPHAISQRDVFGPGDGWKPALQKLVWNGFLKNGWTPYGQDAASIKKGLEDDIIKPTRWFFTRDGLTFSPDPYEGGCYACNPGQAHVSWNQLKPFLAANAVVP